jgi:hypothetical protein
MRLHRVVLAVALGACGAKAGGGSHPAAKPVDLAGRADEIAGAHATRCLVNRLARSYGQLPGSIAPEAPTEVVEIAYRAAMVGASDQDRALLEYELGTTLADRGQLDAARAEIDRARKDSGGDYAGEEVEILLGEPVPDSKLDLATIPALVRAGHADRAAETLAAHPADDEHLERSPVDVGAAYAALGKTDDLQALIAKAKPATAIGLAAGWLQAALAVGLDLDAPVAAVVAARKADPDRDDDLVYALFSDPHARGHGVALAPLRAALREGITGDRRPVDLLTLLHVAHVDGADAAETTALEQALAAAPPLIASQVPVVDAIDRGSVDDAWHALDGLRAALPDHEDLAQFYVATLWGRIVADGFGAADVAKLEAAECDPSCLVGDLPGVAFEVTASTDAKAAAATVAGATARRCGLTKMWETELTVQLDADALAAPAIAAARAGLDAKFGRVAVGVNGCELLPPRPAEPDAGDADSGGGEGEDEYDPPPRTLVVDLQADPARAWFGLVSSGQVIEQREVDIGESAAAAREALVGDYGVEVTQIAAEPGAPASSLTWVLGGLCHDGAIELRTPAELPAGP